MAVSINHDMDQGSNFSFSIVAKGSDNLPLSLTGSTASCQMRKYYTSGTAITLATALTGGTGYILVSLGATGTSQTKPGVYFYDVENVTCMCAVHLKRPCEDSSTKRVQNVTQSTVTHT